MKMTPTTMMLLLLLLSVATSPTNAQRCPMKLWLLDAITACTPDQVPYATAQLYADNTCRLADSNPNLPGSYIASCNEAGNLVFTSSACLSNTCSSSLPGSNVCERASTRTNPAALWAAISYHIVQSPSLETQFYRCYSQSNSAGLVTWYVIFGDCSDPSCGPAPPPTLAPAPLPTLHPTKSPVPPPTLAPITPPTNAPITPARTTRPPVRPPTSAPVRPPTLAPVRPPTSAPVRPPTLAPVRPPTSGPVRPPTSAPVRPPTSAPVRPPTSAPVRPPTSAPITPPTSAPVRPPTSAPITPPTSAPVRPPTSAPVRPPTSAPVTPPTSAPVTPPTSAPFTPPTSAPVRPPTSAPITSATTVAPVTSPTNAPITPAATQAPVAPPTSAPITSTPTLAPVTPPTLAPATPLASAPITSAPTVAPVAPPTTPPITPPIPTPTSDLNTSPSLLPSTLLPTPEPTPISAPTSGSTAIPSAETINVTKADSTRASELVRLEMLLTATDGLLSGRAAIAWESVTARHIEERALQEMNWRVSITTNIIQQRVTNGLSSRRERFLQGGSTIKPLLIKFDATVDFESVPENVSADDLIGETFNSVSERDLYRDNLQEEDPVFAFVMAVKILVEGEVPIEERSQLSKSSENNSTEKFIAGVVICVSILVAAVTLFMVLRRRRRQKKEKEEKVDQPPDSDTTSPNVSLQISLYTAGADPATKVESLWYDFEDDAMSAMTSLPGLDGLTLVEDRTVSVTLDYDFLKQQGTYITDDKESETIGDASHGKTTEAGTSTLLGLDYLDPTVEEDEDHEKYF